jgi:predicted nucleic acid-binding Zn ribbon protein
MVKKDSQVERLGDVLSMSLKRLQLGQQLGEYGVWPVWNDVVGAPIARNAQPEKIRNGTLFVKVASPVWMQQLQYMKIMIVEKINQRLKADIVKNIFFVVGKIDSAPTEEKPQTARPQNVAPADGQLDDKFLESIENPEIRQAFSRLLRSYARWKEKH